MVKKLFAFAGLATFGFLVGVTQTSCSDDDPAGTTSGDGTIDSGRRDATPIVEDPPAASCLHTDPIDHTRYTYKPARPKQPGACSNDELKALGDYFENLGPQDPVSIDDWMDSVGDACAACAFADIQEEEWTPVLTIGSTDLVVNLGGCIESVSGDAECGKVVQQWDQCLLDACFLDCPPGDTEAFVQCRRDTRVLTTSCKGAWDAVRTTCGSRFNSYLSACSEGDWTFDSPVKQACGGTPVDGGTDDAGDAGEDADAN